MPQKVHLEIGADGIAMIRLDDGKANTLETTFITEMSEALDRAEARAKAVVIAGRPGMFSGGLDLKVLPTFDIAQLRAFLLSFTRLGTRLLQFRLPIVAAVGGHAIAGGAVLALTTDFRIMSEGAFHIGLREVAVGIPLPAIGCEIARAVLPPTSLVGATMRGEVYEPHVALAKGMIDRVVAADDLIRSARDEALALAALAQPAYAITKRALRSLCVERIEARAESDVLEVTAAMRAG